MGGNVLENDVEFSINHQSFKLSDIKTWEEDLEFSEAELIVNETEIPDKIVINALRKGDLDEIYEADEAINSSSISKASVEDQVHIIDNMFSTVQEIIDQVDEIRYFEDGDDLYDALADDLWHNSEDRDTFEEYVDIRSFIRDCVTQNHNIVPLGNGFYTF